jgi:hypothetical protein
MRVDPAEANGLQFSIPFELIHFNLDYSILVSKTFTELGVNFFSCLIEVL